MRIPQAVYTDSTQISGESAKPVSSKGAASLSLSGGASSGAADNVQLSGVSRVLQSGSAARAARIAHLADLVQSGQYAVSASALSKSMISETLAQSSYGAQPGEQPGWPQ
jgi:anti-sigma28 factor (negative regulator of flagellin synthesis)